MIFLLVAGVLTLALIGGFLWASGGQSLPVALGSGIIEAIPDAMETEPAPPAGALGIVSYRMGYGLEPNALDVPPPTASVICDRLDQIIETIVSSGADIVFLQEADFSSQRTHDIDQLYYIASALGWGYAARTTTWECRYFPNAWPWRKPDGRIRAGIGVISRYPLVQNMRQLLPHAQMAQRVAARWLPRPVVQMVDVQCGNTVLRLLQANFGKSSRRLSSPQMQALTEFVHDVQTPTSVLMGLSSTAEAATGSDSAWHKLASELHERFRLITHGDNTSAERVPSGRVTHALVGTGLSALDTQVLAVSEPIPHEPPQLLRLRWALPLMGMNGRS